MEERKKGEGGERGKDSKGKGKHVEIGLRKGRQGKLEGMRDNFFPIRTDCLLPFLLISGRLHFAFIIKVVKFKKKVQNLENQAYEPNWLTRRIQFVISNHHVNVCPYSNYGTSTILI